MAKKFKKGLFIFRRDLRLEDNLGLLQALEVCETVLCSFIFDPQQVDRSKNKYFSEAAFYFLINSLKELNQDLKNRNSAIHLFEGSPAEVVVSLIKNEGIEAVFVNKDYTPFARRRDDAIDKACEEKDIYFERCDDVCLSHIESIRTNEGGKYTVFTPFMKKASKETVASPRKNNFQNFFTGTVDTKIVHINEYTTNPPDQVLLQGGREEALALLRDTAFLSSYKTDRNLPATKGTSRLSAHHKFGTISIRETYHTVVEATGAHSQFISELYWRDFYYYIIYHFPSVIGQSFLPWAQHIPWKQNDKHFAAWCTGQTGVPLVDAGMRELNATGWIHNRSRMIVASYLTKNLLINWQKGERYFAQKLIDYDPAQNNGGWQWSASTGADPRPLRIFNPYTQAEKYDAEAIYIKKWVPELSLVADETLTDGKTQDFSKIANYPAPLVDQKETYHRARVAYKKAREIHDGQ